MIRKMGHIFFLYEGHSENCCLKKEFKSPVENTNSNVTTIYAWSAKRIYCFTIKQSNIEAVDVNVSGKYGLI